ncbi:MAG: helix-turn-helix domain-containing protein [Sphingomonadales bacterium]
MYAQGSIDSAASAPRQQQAKFWDAPYVKDAETDLNALGLCQRFARHGEIHAQGEPADKLYKVLTGAVRTAQLLADGRRQIGGFYLPGEVFGLADGEPHGFTAEALAPTTLLVLRRDTLISRAARDPKLSRDLWQLTTAQLARTERHLMVLGRKTALERVACFLLDLSARGGDNDDIVLPMCRQDIADYLGLTIETVSRMMTRLEQMGLIALPSSRRVRLCDADALRDLEE